LWLEFGAIKDFSAGSQATYQPQTAKQKIVDTDSAVTMAAGPEPRKWLDEVGLLLARALNTSNDSVSFDPSLPLQPDG
jgi:hypothetical protein